MHGIVEPSLWLWLRRECVHTQLLLLLHLHRCRLNDRNGLWLLLCVRRLYVMMRPCGSLLRVLLRMRGRTNNLDRLVVRLLLHLYRHGRLRLA